MLNETIYLYDLSSLLELDLKDIRNARKVWDHYHLVTSLQGLVNRNEPLLYIRSVREIDDFWLEQLTAEGAWCHGREVRRVGSIGELLGIFRTAFHGAVVYDERVAATSNVASTICGAEKLLCVRYDESPASIYQQLIVEQKLLEPKRVLMAEDGSPMFTGKGTIPGTSIPSTGSAKNDAYRWMIEHYVRTGKVTNPRLLGYYIDSFWLQAAFVEWPQNHTLSNHDYVIAKGGAFFDLSVWPDEAPVDDKDQRPGTDLETLKLLMETVNARLEHRRLIHVAGYVPWAFKYTDFSKGEWSAGGTRGGVPAEWLCTEILTAYNAYLDADALSYAAMANASFFSHCPLPSRIPQSPQPTEELMREKGFIDGTGTVVPRNYYAHYVGDYDAAAWVYWNLPTFWTDPARGKVPLSWAFNPNLSERFGFGLKWARDRRTENDHFVAGDSGAGYVNPRNLEEPRPYSGFRDAMHLWEEHCRSHMQQWDLHIVGFVLDGNLENMTAKGWDAYARFAPGGCVFHRHAGGPGLHNGMPYMTTAGDLPRDKALLAAEDLKRALKPHGLNFVCFRSVLMPPSWYAEIEEELDRLGRGDAVAVDMGTLLWLLRRHQQSLAKF